MKRCLRTFLTVLLNTLLGISFLIGWVWPQTEEEPSDSASYRAEFSLFYGWGFYRDRKTQSQFSVIPELQYTSDLDSGGAWDTLLAVKLSSILNSTVTNQSDQNLMVGELYRMWFRYSLEQSEFRIGLQKIDFGSATLLRPLQWFNNLQHDDPLQQTPGVWAFLFRYYFLNNANLWLWGLWGNESPRGLDLTATASWYPEAGGRLQIPVPRGEVALSLHYRVATTEGSEISFLNQSRIPEIRGGLDSKLDLGVGFWVELVLNHSFQNLREYTDQILINLGMDYTFDLGNGYNVVLENLITSFDSSPFQFKSPVYDSIMVHQYPVGLSDSILFTAQYRWITHEPSLNFTWEHQFSESVLNWIVYYQSSVISRDRIHDTGLKVFWKYVL